MTDPVTGEWSAPLTGSPLACYRTKLIFEELVISLILPLIFYCFLDPGPEELPIITSLQIQADYAESPMFRCSLEYCLIILFLYLLVCFQLNSDALNSRNYRSNFQFFPCRSNSK